MNNKAAKLLRVMCTKPDGELDKKMYKQFKKVHKSLPWYRRYVRGAL